MPDVARSWHCRVYVTALLVPREILDYCANNSFDTSLAMGTGGATASIAGGSSDVPVSSTNAGAAEKSGGCGCRMAPSREDSPWMALCSLLGALSVAGWRRRDRCRR